MTVGQINMMKYEAITDGMEAATQVRYNDGGVMSALHQKGDEVKVEFFANVRGIAPGQSAVFYENDDVIGGGIIKNSSFAPMS